MKTLKADFFKFSSAFIEIFVLSWPTRNLLLIPCMLEVFLKFPNFLRSQVFISSSTVTCEATRVIKSWRYYFSSVFVEVGGKNTGR